jgi:hypothetical protein
MNKRKSCKSDLRKSKPHRQERLEAAQPSYLSDSNPAQLDMNPSLLPEPPAELPQLAATFYSLSKEKL